MAKKPTLSDITNVYTSAPTTNSNNSLIEQAFENTVSRDGSGPNQMEADLDLNHHNLLNVDVLKATDIEVGAYGSVSDIVGRVEAAASNAEESADRAHEDREAVAVDLSTVQDIAGSIESRVEDAMDTVAPPLIKELVEPAVEGAIEEQAPALVTAEINAQVPGIVTPAAEQAVGSALNTQIAPVAQQVSDDAGRAELARDAAEGYAAAVPAQVARIETKWRRREFVETGTFENGIGDWVANPSNRMTLSNEAGNLILTGTPGETAFTQLMEGTALKTISAQEYTATISGVADAAVEFRFQVYSGTGSGSVVYTGPWNTFEPNAPETFVERIPVGGLANINVRTQWRNYAGARIEIDLISGEDTTPEAAYLDLKRGVVDLSGMKEAVAGGAAANQSIAAGNSALIQAALTESYNTGRTVKIGKGSWPMTRVRLPDHGGFTIEMEPGAVLKPVAPETSGFFRQSGWYGNSLYMPNVRTYGLRIEPFLDGDGNPMAGNPLVARIKNSPDLHGWHFVYHADQAFVITPGNCQIHSPYIYTEDVDGGSGGARLNGGYDSVVIGLHGRSGDDGMMLLGGAPGIYRCGFRGARLSGARARLVWVSAHQGGAWGDVVDCFATDIVGTDGGESIIGINSTSDTRKVKNFRFSGQVDHSYVEKDGLTNITAARPGQGIAILGNTENVHLDITSRSPDRLQTVLVTQGQIADGPIQRPKNTTINLRGSLGDHVPGEFGAERPNYSDSYGHVVRVHGADGVRVNFEGFSAGGNRYGVTATQSTGVYVTGDLSLADADKPAIWAPDSVADVEVQKLYGFGFNGPQPDFYPDPVTPHNRGLRVSGLSVSAGVMSLLGQLTASTARFDDTIGGGDRHLGWAPVQGLAVEAMPTEGNYIAGTGVALRNPILSGSSVVSGYRRLTTGAAHVLGTDWAAEVSNLVMGGPVNTAAPEITGTAERGQVLTCSTGTWSSGTSITYAYQWRRVVGGGSTPISGATASTYTLTETDDGAMIGCVVTATDALMSATATASAVGPVLGAPKVATPAGISGDAVVGAVLTGTPAVYQGVEPFHVLHRWLRNGTLISGETSTSYTLVEADIGATIQYRTQCRNDLLETGAYVTSVSDPIGPVEPAP